MDRKTLAKPGSVTLCLVSVLAVCVGWYLLRSAGQADKIRRVVLISIDTCRADHLGCYGGRLSTTPHLDAVADEGTRFENTYAPVPLTLPAHCSMMTGTIPPFHGVHDNLDARLGPTHVTLAEVLQDAGFTTAAFVGAFVLDSQFGLDQGFETYNDRFEEQHDLPGVLNERKGDEITRLALDWLSEHEEERFFLFLHYYDPHYQYEPPEPFATRFAGRPYAGEVAYTDHCIGQVIRRLKELDLYESTLLVIVGDHGEMLGEHGEGRHSYFIYESAVRVPLIFKLPGQRQARVINDLAGLVDVTPTVCGMLGLDVPPEVQGEDLSEYLAGKKHPAQERFLYCESLTPTKYGANSLLGVIAGRWKYIQTTEPELYNLTADPLESNNRIATEPARAEFFKDRLAQILEQQYRAGDADSRLVLDDEDRRRLESLGYVGSSLAREDFVFDQTKEDPKGLIGFHTASGQVTALLFQKKYDEARRLCEELLRQRPDFVRGYIVIAQCAIDQGNFGEAIPPLREALKHRPDEINLHGMLGAALAARGRLDEAIVHFRRTVEIDPDSAEANLQLGVALASHGGPEEALGYVRRAVEINPDHAEARYQLGQLLLRATGRLDLMLEQCLAAMRLKPEWPAPINSAAWILAAHPDAAIRDPAEAVRLAERACELSRHRNAGHLDTLATAYAAAGQFNRAVTTAQQAVALATAGGAQSLAHEIRERLELYRKGIPYREHE